MAIMRGMEARVDHRFWEVLIAEAMAFMGNRSLRWWARHLVDWTSEFWIFPLFVVLVDEEWEYAGMVWKIVILVMGLLRGILPFMFSFVGSRIGRSTALAASDRMNYRWKTVQYVQDFVVSAGTHRPTLDDSALLLHATNIATAIGDGKDPVNVRDNLSYLGFEIIGTGAGGYALYRSIEYEDQGTTLHLHLTPYGPSILDEIPRYILLERKSVDSISSYHSHEFCTIARMKTDAVLKGFSFSGAFFTFQEWAALKTRHDNEFLSFNMACKYMCHKSNSFHAVDHYSPPKDLLSLKTFIRTGQVPKKKKKSNKQWAQVMKQLDELSKKLIHMEREGIAPNGVIIYMEGLDCAGKSSTGGLIMQALEDAGYDMSSHRYNRPPTVEERTKPWMWRFKQPEIMLEGKKIKKSALVWDRGPGECLYILFAASYIEPIVRVYSYCFLIRMNVAGDFVYGNLNDLPQELKLQRYVDFHKFEEDCISNGIIFCKLLFVTSKDSIAKTLGKRLAHKKIVGDLHTWLDANSTNHSEKEGLQEIENHIDPTDFIAVNNYDYNKKIFHEFVLHTDHIGRLHSNSHNALCDYFPWLIINTSDRHRARIQIMKSFEKQLDQYAKSMYSNSTTSNMISDGSVGSSAETDEDFERLLMDPRQPFEHGCKENPGKILVALKESFIYMLVMLIIAGSYLHQTWKIGF